MRNLEFKARIEDPREVQRRATALGFDLWGDLRQTDTYFATPRGRLKLRETPGHQAELIFYERDEAAPERPSEYEVAHSADVEALRGVLGAALGVLAVVRKRRTLLLLDTTRVHLDNVDRLGWFVEIEVPVRDNDASAASALSALITGLGLEGLESLRCSYLDLALAQQTADI